MSDAVIKIAGKADRMGHEIKVQVVERAGGTQYTITIPRPVAELWGLKKGDSVILEQDPWTGKITLQKKQTK